jgi:IS30 family transposase
MSKNIPGNQKHLKLEERLYIEQALNENKSFKDIARFLCKDPSTISKEIRNHRVENKRNRGSFNNPNNFCIHRFRCKKRNVCDKIMICDRNCRSCYRCNLVCPRFEREVCRRLEHAPYVCNGCDKLRNRCPISTKYDYRAAKAQEQYELLRKTSREGFALTRKQRLTLDSIVTPLIQQGQSPYMTLANHPELGISVKTLYNYIDAGYLTARNIDLKRKVKFKPRKVHKKQITDREVFKGRSYADFCDLHLELSQFVEMDTVHSARGSLKCFLTLYFPDTELLVAHMMNRCTAGAVRLVFERLQRSLGGPDSFHTLFPVILTDRGAEFGNPERLENSPEGTPRSSIYYCDPMRSDQKAGIENIHTMLRMIFPKGTDFQPYTQWDLRKAVDHINSTPRSALSGDTPYSLALKKNRL